VQANNKQLLKDEEQLKQELKLQCEKTEEIKKTFAEKSEQVLSSFSVLQIKVMITDFVDSFKLIQLQRMREEMDICVGQLRQEVTSLQVFLAINSTLTIVFT